MIKIIKTGKLKVGECPQCGCVFSYEDEDTQYNQYSLSKDGRTITKEGFYKTLNCPQCTRTVKLEEVERIL